MRIPFDQGTPEPLIPFLTGHIVTQAKDVGWERLVNGELLKAAETAGFQVLLTTAGRYLSNAALHDPPLGISEDHNRIGAGL